MSVYQSCQRTVRKQSTFPKTTVCLLFPLASSWEPYTLCYVLRIYLCVLLYQILMAEYMYMYVQLWQMKLGLINLGRTFNVLVWCNGFQIIQPVWHAPTAFAVTEARGWGGGAVGLFVHTQVIIPDFICRNCTWTFNIDNIHVYVECELYYGRWSTL